MNNQIQLVLKSSTAEMSLNDHELGIYLTPELDGLVGLPEIRTTSGVNSGYDGGWTSAQNYDARSITIRGVIANTDVATVERLRKQLVSLAGQGKSEELTLDLVTEAGNAYTLQVRTIALEMAMQSVLEKQEFMLQLRADDPLIYDAGESAHEATLQVAKATGGFTIDFELPLAITGGSEESVVNNDGLEEVPTIVKMYGALHNPKIINQTNNEQMQIMADLGYAEGAWHTPSESSEGTNISLANTPDSAPFSDIQLKGNTSQQTYSGKNLFNYTNPTASASGLNTTLNQDGTLTTTGVPTSNFVVIIPAKDITNMLEDGATYTVQHSDSGNYLNLQVTAPKVGGGSDYYIGKSFTVNKTTHSSYKISVVSTTTANWGTSSRTIKAWYQLEKSNTATAFEPYVGGIPAPNPDYPQAVQTVTGENVVEITGKNLLDNSLHSTITYSGTTSTIDGSTWSIVKTGNGGISLNPRTDYLPVNIPTGQTVSFTSYPVSGSVSASTTYYQIRVYFYDANKTLITNLATATTATDIMAQQRTGTWTATQDVAYIRLGEYISSGTGTTDGATLHLQLELGSTATAYEPYQGQSYEVNLGKNLFDPAIAVHPTGMPNNIGETLPVSTNTTYTFAVGNDRSFAQVQLFNASGTRTRTLGNGASDHTLTFTTTASEVSALFCFYPGQAGIDPTTYDYTGVQLEKGSQATSYAAYFAPIELCKIGDYQDYIHESGGKWYVHKAVGKVVLNGSESDWTRGPLDGNATYRFFVTISGIKTTQSQDSLGLVLSDKLIEITNGSQYSGTEGIRVRSNGAEQLSISTYATQTMTVDNFKAWLAANNIIAYYALATPTDTEITNEALIEQLDNLLNLSRTYQGQTNMADLAASGNMPAILNVSYYTEKEPDTRDELIIDSRLHTVTLNGLDIYHLIGEGSEFLMLEPGENRLSLQSDITGDNGYAVVSYKQGYLSI